MKIEEKTTKHLGTPRSGKKGFAAEIKAANQFVDAFQGDSGEFPYLNPILYNNVKHIDLV